MRRRGDGVGGLRVCDGPEAVAQTQEAAMSWRLNAGCGEAAPGRPRRPDPADAEDGIDRPADGRDRPRFQQYADGRHRLAGHRPKRRIRADIARAETGIDHALEGAKRAAQLTARLLAFSRQQPLAPQALDLNKLVGGMSEMLRRTIGEDIDDGNRSRRRALAGVRGPGAAGKRDPQPVRQCARRDARAAAS